MDRIIALVVALRNIHPDQWWPTGAPYLEGLTAVNPWITWKTWKSLLCELYDEGGIHGSGHGYWYQIQQRDFRQRAEWAYAVPDSKDYKGIPLAVLDWAGLSTEDVDRIEKVEDRTDEIYAEGQIEDVIDAIRPFEILDWSIKTRTPLQYTEGYTKEGGASFRQWLAAVDRVLCLRLGVELWKTEKKADRPGSVAEVMYEQGLDPVQFVAQEFPWPHPTAMRPSGWPA